MPVYSDLVTANALGAAAQDTFTAVGTITMKPFPGRIIGAWLNGAPDANTAAEAIISQFNFDFGEVGLKELLVTGPCIYGESVATQSVGDMGPALLVPLNIPFHGNERIPITAGWHASGTPTAGLNAMAGLLYVVGAEPPMEWRNRYPELIGCSGGDSEASAAVTATATAITDLQIPALSKNMHVCGYACGVAQDAAGRTAEDMVLGIDFGTSTFPDWSPQIYPFAWKFPNLAGTLVGGGIRGQKVTWPAWMPTNGVSGQITPKVLLNTTMTDGHAIAVDVFYTK